jgi:hypothetical protein
MRAQLWVFKAQVGCGKGLELVVVEGRVRSRPGRGNCSQYPARAPKSGLGGVGFEVLRVVGNTFSTLPRQAVWSAI